MATEKYGVYAQLVKSSASTPVSTDTNVIFIGASPSGELHKPQLITSMSEYQTKLGGAPGDGYNLTEAAIAAFSVAGINQVYMIPVSNSTEFDADDYIGDAELFTGVYAIENLLRENPTTVNILCAPSVTDSSVLAALNTIAKKADGHWVSFMVYDVEENADQINEGNAVVVDEVVASKQLNDELADAVWGHVKTSGGYIVSGAAVRACLMAASDANYGVPARCGGNLAIGGIQGIVGTGTTLIDAAIAWGDETSVSPLPYPGAEAHVVKRSESHTPPESDRLKGIPGTEYELSTPVEGLKVYANSVGNIMARNMKESGAINMDSNYIQLKENSAQVVTLTESAATQLSADGICSYINYGGGNWHTWGDHTSAFSAGSVDDERARYDSNLRMLIMLTNRFQLKYRFSIDDPMTLTMRNDVIQEENDYLAYIKSIGAIIGDATCSFKADDNPVDNIALGQFVWSIESTITPPLKHAQLNVAYSQAGLSVYYQ
jgi:hypothetical protein